MAGDQCIRRIGLVRSSAPNEAIRRYRLARLDEIALAAPYDRVVAKPGSPPSRRDSSSGQARDPPETD
jgi:hypothetical protein